MSQITDTRLRCAALAAFASCATVMPGTAAPVHGDAAVRHEIVQAAERGQSIEPAKTPDGVATLKVAWKNTAGGAGSFKRMPVKPLPLDWSVPVVCRLYLPAGSGLRAFNLRIEDASGETFQYYRTIPGDATGWIAITNIVDVANPPGSWGGNGDRCMDLPLSVCGAGFDFDKTAAGGFFLFAPVEHAAPGGAARWKQVDLAGEPAAVTLLAAGKRGQSHATTTLPDGRRARRIDWRKTGETKFDLMFGGGMTFERFGAASLRVKAYLPEPGMLRALNLRLQDADGEALQYVQTIPSDARGWYDVVFPINATLRAPTSWGGSAPNKMIDFPARLSSLAGVFARPETPGWMALDTVQIELLPGPLEPVFEIGTPIGVLCPGAESRLGWRIVNTSSGPVSGVLQYDVSDVHGTTVASNTLPVKVAAGAEVFVPLPAPAKRGIYSVGMVYREEGISAPPSRSLRSFSYMAPAGPTPGKGEGFIFGVCSHSQWHPPEVQELQALAASLCGVKMLREDMLWERMEPRQGAWNFRFFDSVVKIFDRHGIEVAPIYCYRPEWAVARDWKPIRPESPRGKRPDFGHWANFIRTAASRYGDRIRYVEVWNEPDLLGYANFTAEEYIEMLKIAYAETKKAAPDVTVLTGGFTMMPPFLNIVDPQHMEKTLTQGRGYYDVQAFHVHGIFERYREQVDRLMEFRKELGVTAPWWANETAITSTGFGEYVQARTPRPDTRPPCWRGGHRTLACRRTRRSRRGASVTDPAEPSAWRSCGQMQDRGRCRPTRCRGARSRTHHPRAGRGSRADPQRHSRHPAASSTYPAGRNSS